MTKISLLGGRQGKRLIKYFQTMHLLMAGITLGLVLVIVGPTLLDLADLLGVSLREMTFIAFGGDFGAFAGSALALVIFKYFSAQKVIIFFMLLIGVSNILIPLGGSPAATAALTFCSGCGVGIVEIGAYVWLVGMWASNVAPIIQLLHLTYGIGAFMSPLIAEPYLAHHSEEFIDPVNASLVEDRSLNVSLADPLFQGTTRENASFIDAIDSLSSNASSEGFPGPASHVHIPYALVGCFALLNAAFMIVSYFMDSSDVKPEEPAEEEEARIPTSPAYRWTLVCLIGVYTLVSVILEVTVGKFLPAYVVHHYSLSRSSGAFIVSLFYIGFTLGRVAAVPLSLKLSPMQLMNAAQSGLVSSAALLAFIDYDERVLWTCSFTLGACLSPLFGSATAWLSKHVALSHDFMSIIMTMVTFGALAPPLFVGSYIETHPNVLTWAVLGATCLMMVACWTMHATASVHRRVYRQCPDEDHNHEGDVGEAAAKLQLASV